MLTIASFMQLLFADVFMVWFCHWFNISVFLSRIFLFCILWYYVVSVNGRHLAGKTISSM